MGKVTSMLFTGRAGGVRGPQWENRHTVLSGRGDDYDEIGNWIRDLDYSTLVISVGH